MEVARLHRDLGGKEEGLERTLLNRVLLQAGHKSQAMTADFLYSRAAWEHICASYGVSEDSFINYFWAVPSPHVPVQGNKDCGVHSA